MKEGEFPPGSMAPKIGSLMEALCTIRLNRDSLPTGDALSALRGEAGTKIVVKYTTY